MDGVMTKDLALAMKGKEMGREDWVVTGVFVDAVNVSFCFAVGKWGLTRYLCRKSCRRSWKVWRCRMNRPGVLQATCRVLALDPWIGRTNYNYNYVVSLSCFLQCLRFLSSQFEVEKEKTSFACSTCIHYSTPNRNTNRCAMPVLFAKTMAWMTWS